MDYIYEARTNLRTASGELTPVKFYMDEAKNEGVAPFVERCNERRNGIKEVASAVKQMVDELKQPSETSGKEDRGEMIANLMLTYRHLEDASMRLGKAIQAYDGGKSVYDKETTVGA